MEEKLEEIQIWLEVSQLIQQPHSETFCKALDTFGDYSQHQFH